MATLALAACSGGGDGRDAGSAPATERVDAPTSTSTTTAATSTTTTTVAAEAPPYSFDGSVPPPPLVNTGTDYEAIYRSLEAYSKWLFAHEPSEALLATVAVPESDFFRASRTSIRTLVQRDLRYYENASKIERIEIADVREGLVSLRITYADDRALLIARDGTVVDAQDLPERSTWTALLSRDSAGRWRFASAEPIDDSAEVQL